MIKSTFSILVILFVLIGCKKEDIVFEPTPNIEFVSISPTSVAEFQDEVIVTIKYRDGDGDLGENTPNVKNLFVTDSRNNVEYSYRVQQLAPSEADINIEGQLEINLKTLSVVGTGDSESATFIIYIVDRAGNESNSITTSAITVSR